MRKREQVKVLIITGAGLNCEKETAAAFASCGATAEQVHLNDLLAGKRTLGEFHILALIGGFSFGDHLGSGTVFANKLKFKLTDDLRKFVSDGKLVIGICNGFQTLTRLGLAPALDGQYLIRHGEGKFVADPDVLARIESGHLAAVRYCAADGSKTKGFPENPNGSLNDIAGICDESGRIFGLMPHPEAFLSPFNAPDWQKQKLEGKLPEWGEGRVIFENAVEFAASCL